MKSKLVKIIVALVVIGLIYVGYMWFMPHRDIQSTKAFKTIGATALVNEFLTDKESASDEKMGVSCTFTLETNAQTSNLAQGSNIRVKGVLRSGAEYDEDLVLTENVILEKCSIEK